MNVIERTFRVRRAGTARTARRARSARSRRVQENAICIKRLRAKPDKKIVDSQAAAIPNS